MGIHHEGPPEEQVEHLGGNMKAEAYAKLTDHVSMMAELRDESVHLTLRGVALIALVTYLGVMVTLMVYHLHGRMWALAVMAVYAIGLGAELFCFVRIQRLLKERSQLLGIMIENDITDLVFGHH